MGLSPVGLNVKIIISDPWDFVVRHGSFLAGKIAGLTAIPGVNLIELMVELDYPLKENNESIINVFATSRHVGDALLQLSSGSEVPFNISNVPYADRKSGVSKGPVQFIGGIKIENAFGLERASLNFVFESKRIFKFIVDRGFLLVEALPTIARYRNGDLEADVYHGRQSYELGFEIGRNGVKYSMSELIRATNPAAAVQFRNAAASTPIAITEGLVHLAELVKRYGERALQDDHDFFDVLAEQRKQLAEDYALQVLESQIRPKANEAFRLKHYREAVELYERIRPRLTPAEQQKLSVAKDRSGE